MKVIRIFRRNVNGRSIKRQKGDLMSAYDVLLNGYKRYQNLEKKYRKKFNSLSNLRLFVFLAGAVCFLAGLFLGNKTLAWYILICFLVLFIFLIIKHGKVEQELNMVSAMAEIHRRYLDRINGQWVEFEDTGEEFADRNHTYTYDLDIFGPKSLFQWISVAKTAFGRLYLQTLLAKPDKELDTINIRRNAVRELTTKLEFCQKLECQGLLVGKAVQDTEGLISYAEEPAVLSKAINYIRMLPVFTLLSGVLYFSGWAIPVQIPVLLLLLQILVFLYGSSRISPALGQVYSFHKGLASFRNMFCLIESEQFKNDYLSALRSELHDQTDSASVCMKRLERISDAVNLRYQPLLYFILGMSLLWDFHCAVYLNRWKKQNGKRIRDWFEVIGKLEALSSLAVISHIYPEWSFPEVQNDDMKFIARDLGHPLIQQEKCIRNDIEIKNYSCIVTGSNMSGKSTFLRAIGINLVLAYAGAAVCARQFKCPIIDIFTSMVIRDDLINGISTFYAELTRINMILINSRKGRPIFYLIDEIFRGTNSLDRIAGAEAVLRELSKNRAIGLISTHDFELCELEKDRRLSFKNYHFEEQYLNGSIKFDYKLCSDRCTTSNAKYLMNMVGISVSE